MYGVNDTERIKLNNQIKEWNSNRLDLFQISEPNDYLEFYGVMRFFYQGDDLKYQTKCLRVSSTATTLDVVDALVVKFHPDLRMLNNDRYMLYENHNLEDRKMKNGEHPLVVQLNWALDDKDGKFILRNESRRRRSIDMTTHAVLSNNGMSRSTSALANGFDNQTQRTQSSSVYSNPSNFFSKRFSSSKKSRRKSKSEKDTVQNAQDAKRLAEENSGKPPESSFTRTISNPDDVMKRRRQKKLESRLEQFSGVSGDGETGGTLKIYGDSINPDIPYKTLLLSVNDTAEKVLAETLDKYGLSSEDHRFFVLVQQNIPPRDDRNRGNVEEIILHDQDCPLGILVHCPPKRGSATFAVRRVTPHDRLPTSIRMPSFAFSRDSVTTNEQVNRKMSDSDRRRLSSSPIQPNQYLNTGADYPRLRQLIVDADGSLYDEDNGIFSLSSLVNSQLNESLPNEGSKFIKIGSQSSTVGDYPNVLLSQESYPDIRPVHCHISAKLDSQTNVLKLQLTPTLDSTSRTPRPCVTFINQQRIDNSTRLVNGDMIQLGESVMFRFEEFDEEVSNGLRNNGSSQDTCDNSSNAMRISYLTADLPVTVKYEYQKSQRLVDNIIQVSKEYAENGCKELFGNNLKFDIINLDKTFRLSPAYLMYLVIRAGLANDQQIIQLINLIADRIDRVIQQDRNSVEKEIFWLSNTSELLHLLQYDNDLRHYSVTAQDVLASAIERSFSIVQNEFSKDLMILLPSLLNDDDQDLDDNTLEDNIPCLDRSSVLIQQGGIDYPIQHLLQTLSLAFNLFNNCQVNVALTIQMFSQLFHLLNTWLFNSVLGDQQSDVENTFPIPVSQEWGKRLMRRLNRIRYWSEINGLEMAANCHLQKMYQVAELMEADKRDLNIFGEKCIEMVNLNGAQLHHLLVSCQDYDLPDAWIEVVVSTAIQLHDQAFNDHYDSKVSSHNKNTLPLYEDMDLRLPLLLPADGYCCDRGIVSCPSSLRTMLRSMKDILTYSLNPPVLDQIDTRWKSYLGICESTPTVSRANTIGEQSIPMPLNTDASYLPRNWVTNDGVSNSDTVSSNRERFQKKTANNQSQNKEIRPSFSKHESDNFDHSQDQKYRFELKLSKIENSLGLSIIAAKASDKDINRIFVKDVIVGGAGYKCGKIASGDQLVAIDGNSLEDMSQDEAVALMKRTKADVVLIIEKAAAQKYGVMDIIVQARNNKVSSSAKKSPRQVSNSQPTSSKKPVSKSSPSPRKYTPKEETHIKTTRAQLVLPVIPTDNEPPRPQRLVPSSNSKASHRKVSDLDDMDINYSSLPARNKKVSRQQLPEIPAYAKKDKVHNDKIEIKPVTSKPFKSNSQPNLSSLDQPSKKPCVSSSSGSISSGSSSSYEKIQVKSTPQSKVSQSNQPKLSMKPAVSMTTNVNIQPKSLGIPRHEIAIKATEPPASVSKRQVFSRPVISQEITPDNNESILSNKKPLLRNDEEKRHRSSSSESESESLSSDTVSTSSSDHSPQPQKKIIPKPQSLPSQSSVTKQPIYTAPIKANEPSPDRRASVGVGNLGGFKRPSQLTSSKSTEQLTNSPNKDFLPSPKSPSRLIDQSLNRNNNPVDDDLTQLGTVNVNSYSPFTTLPPPPAPTASYPQYHPPDNLEESDQTTPSKFDFPKPPTEDEIKFRKKEMANKIRQETEERAKKPQSVESVPIDIQPPPPVMHVDNKDTSKSNIKYGRPQFHERTQATRPVSLFKPETNPNDSDARLPSPPPAMFQTGIVVPPSPIIKSKVIGSHEIYKDPYKNNRASKIDTSQDGVEELPFRDKMKLFAEKIGEEKVVNRNRFSSKQRQIDSEDFS